MIFEVFVEGTLVDTIYSASLAESLIYDIQLTVKDKRVDLSKRDYEIFKSHKYALDQITFEEGDEYL